MKLIMRYWYGLLGVFAIIVLMGLMVAGVIQP